MPSWKTFFAGRYINASVVGEEGQTYTIRGVQAEDIEDPDKGNTRVGKMVIYFRETDKGFVPSRTVAECLGAMFGEDVGGWQGRRVRLYKDPTIRVGKQTKGGIRVAGSPDIPHDMRVSVKLPQRRAKTYDLKRFGDPCPLGEALRAQKLIGADYDTWAALAGRPSWWMTPPDKRAAAAEWVVDKGADTIREAVRAAGGES